MFFSTASWNRFFCDFYRFFLSPNLESAAHSQCFATIFTKSTFSKNMRKKLDFGSILGGQNDEKSRKNDVEKHAFFEHRFLCVFLRILAILARFWEARALQKIAKNRKNRFWSAFGTHWVFHGRFGRVLGAFWEGFGMVLGWFWAGFFNFLARFCIEVLVFSANP